MLDSLLESRPTLREFGRSLPLLAQGIVKAVNLSFKDKHAMRASTQAELRRRVLFCVETALELRSGKRWSTERIADALPKALDCLLSGTRYEPEADERRVWTPSDFTIVNP